jgi:curved DNA-binding protein CbpA
VPEPVSWYDVLGVSRGASAVTLRRAHDERLLQLHSYLPSAAHTTPAEREDASSRVASAASRAAAAVEEAWQVLGDPERRKRYDARFGLCPPVPPRGRLIVPDVRGLFYRPSQAVAALAGLRLAVVRLTSNPLPVEGLVVGQSPDPGATVRHRSTLTVQVWHPERAG